MKPTNIAAPGIALIKDFEKCVLTAYPDAKGLPTIGWGHRIPALGVTWTQEQADETLKIDLAKFSAHVYRLINIQLNQNQFDALVCFAFNVGDTEFQTSTLLRMTNAGNYAGAAAQFERWDHITQNGVLIELNGLKRRRDAERELFLTPVVNA